MGSAADGLSINDVDRNVVEGNWVQPRAGRSTAKTGIKMAKKPGLAVSWKFVSEGRNVFERNRVQLQDRKAELPRAGIVISVSRDCNRDRDWLQL